MTTVKTIKFFPVLGAKGIVAYVTELKDTEDCGVDQFLLFDAHKQKTGFIWKMDGIAHIGMEKSNKNNGIEEKLIVDIPPPSLKEACDYARVLAEKDGVNLRGLLAGVIRLREKPDLYAALDPQELNTGHVSKLIEKRAETIKAAYSNWLRKN